MTFRPFTRPRRLLLLGALLTLIYCTCYHLWYHPPEAGPGPFRLAQSLKGHRSVIWTARFLPGDSLVLSAGADSTLSLWRRSGGPALRSWKGPSGITYLALSRDGRYAATAGYDARVRIWSLPDGALLHTLEGPARTTWTVHFSPDASVVAAGSEEGHVFLWNRASGQLLQRLKGHQRNVWDLAFSPDGGTLVSGSFDRTINVWNARSGALLRTLTDHDETVVALDWSRDGTLMASTSDDCTVKLWNTRTWTVLRSLSTPEHQQGVHFRADGRQLITSGRDKTQFGELLQNFIGDSHYNKGISMRLWDVPTGKLLQTFRHHANDVNDVQFSSDGRAIVAAGADGEVSVWEEYRL
ncbi:WD40 repeat domain-containing protein [Flaviaesturariibacter amylovorans]|uniref:WD40 repeat domain-containing protein n=1 Tax=Flaviaesturariibacter amylovorans TaxID=1084520 RepID=A0ABP8HFZ5_9BACT